MFIVLVKLPLVCNVVLSPVVLTLSAAIHVYEDVTSLVKVTLTVPPLQIVNAEELLIVGTGFTVTATDWVVPAQLPAVEVGVTL